MERTHIVSLFGRRIYKIVRDRDQPVMLLFLDEANQILFRVHSEYLFDYEGNHFHPDID